MVISPLAPDQTIAQMWSSGARGGIYNSSMDLFTAVTSSHTSDGQ